ncbi:MAG: hypothetical protein LBI78_05545, partial [Campylobacteraceae bacterium]|nr:hypothetical protein [Campylobacteraceae bacterium]
EKYPGDSNLAYDNASVYPEYENLKNKFKGKQWYELENEFIFNEKDSLFFFGKKGFKYFIPAFMIASIEAFDETDNLPDIVIGKFTLPTEIDDIILANQIKLDSINRQNPERLNDFFRNSLKEKNKQIHTFIDCMIDFNKEQCKSIRDFLEYMTKYSDELYNDPQIAIERYWFQF